jgi:hypothetical protein
MFDAEITMGQFFKSAFVTILLIGTVVLALSNRDRILSTVQNGVETILATPDPSQQPTPRPTAIPQTDVATAAPDAVSQATAQPNPDQSQPAPTDTSAPPASNAEPAKVDPVPAARTNPVVLALEQTDKNAHQALIEDLTGGFQAGKSQDELDQIQDTYINDALKRFGPYASGVTLLDLARANQDFTKVLQQGDAGLCWAFVSNNQADAARVRAQRRADSELERRILEAQAAVLTSASTTPSGYVDGDKAPTIVRDLFLKLQEKHGSDVALLTSPTAPGDAGKRCEMSIDMNELLLALPGGEAQDAIRYLLSQAQNTPAEATQPQAQPQSPNVAVTDLEIQAIDQELVKEPYFQALAAAEPERYRDMVIQLVQAQKTGAGANEIAAITAGVSREMLIKYRVRASDEALVSYFRSLTSVAEKVGSQNPAMCYAILALSPQGQANTNSLTPADGRRILSASTQLIRTGTGQEPRQVDTSIGQTALNDATKSLSAESAAAVAQITSGAQIDPNVGCGASIEFYKAVTKLPRTKASSALRVLLANAPQ